MKLFGQFNKPIKRELSIGAGSHKIVIPSKYEYNYDDNQNLLFYPAGEETITIRVTVLSFDAHDENPNPGMEFIITSANEKGINYSTLNDKIAIYESSQSAVEQEENLILKFWNYGSGNSIIIISATILERYKDEPNVKTLLNEMGNIIESIKYS